MAGIDVTKAHLTRAHKHNSPLVSCRFDPSGKHVFFGAQDQRIWRWDLTKDAKTEYAGHDSWVAALGFLPAAAGGAATLVSGGYDGRLMWWPVEGFEQPQAAPLRSVDAHQGWIRGLAVSPDGSLIATAGNDLLVKLWNAADGSLVRELAGHPRPVYHVAFHPLAAELGSGDLMGNLYHWDLPTGKLQRKLAIPALHKYDPTFKADIGGFRDMRFSSDGKQLACAGITNVSNAFAGVGNPLVVLWDWKAGKPQMSLVSKGKLRGVAWGVALHPEGLTIGLSGGGGGGYLLFWKADQAEDFHRLKLPNTARDMDLCSDNLHVATAHHDGHLRITKLAAKD